MSRMTAFDAGAGDSLPLTFLGEALLVDGGARSTTILRCAGTSNADRAAIVDDSRTLTVKLGHPLGVHKRCTRLGGRDRYRSAPDGRPGTKPQLTAFSTDGGGLNKRQISNLNLSVRKYVRVRIPPRAPQLTGIMLREGQLASHHEKRLCTEWSQFSLDACAKARCSCASRALIESTRSDASTTSIRSGSRRSSSFMSHPLIVAALPGWSRAASTTSAASPMASSWSVVSRSTNRRRTASTWPGAAAWMTLRPWPVTTT